MGYQKLEIKKGTYTSIENKIDLSLKFITLGSLFESISNISSYIGNIKSLSIVDSYITSNLLVTLSEEIFPKLKEDLLNNKNKRIKITKDISYSIGIISSLTLSYGYNGASFFLNFTFNLLKNTASTFIMNKLDKLGNIDSISFGILISFIFSIPKFLWSMKDKSWLELLLSILSLAILFKINYKLLNQHKKINILFSNGKKEILELSSSHSYSSSIFIANILYTILNNFITDNILIQSLIILIVPLISYLFNYNNTDNNITEYLQKSEGIIEKIRPGNETKNYINKLLKTINIKYSIIGVLIFIISLFIVKLFFISINPLYIASITNSVIQLAFNTKSINSIKNIKGFLKES